MGTQSGQLKIVKFVEPRSVADPEIVPRKPIGIANSVEPVQDGRIHIDLIDWPFLHELRKAGADFAIEHGSL
jgi:hypothetical protein